MDPGKHSVCTSQPCAWQVVQGEGAQSEPPQAPPAPGRASAAAGATQRGGSKRAERMRAFASSVRRQKAPMHPFVAGGGGGASWGGVEYALMCLSGAAVRGRVGLRAALQKAGSRGVPRDPGPVGGRGRRALVLAKNGKRVCGRRMGVVRIYADFQWALPNLIAPGRSYDQKAVEEAQIEAQGKESKALQPRLKPVATQEQGLAPVGCTAEGCGSRQCCRTRGGLGRRHTMAAQHPKNREQASAAVRGASAAIQGVSFHRANCVGSVGWHKLRDKEKRTPPRRPET